jgi:hypothetical protein
MDSGSHEISIMHFEQTDFLLDDQILVSFVRIRPYIELGRLSPATIRGQETILMLFF